MKKPDWRIKILNKVTGRKNISVGAGWNNNDGSISIVLSPGIVLTDNPDLMISLFHIDTKTDKVEE